MAGRKTGRRRILNSINHCFISNLQYVRYVYRVLWETLPAVSPSHSASMVFARFRVCANVRICDMPSEWERFMRSSQNRLANIGWAVGNMHIFIYSTRIKPLFHISMECNLREQIHIGDPTSNLIEWWMRKRKSFDIFSPTVICVVVSVFDWNRL